MMLWVGEPRAAPVEAAGPDVAGARPEGLRGVHVRDQLVDPAAAIRRAPSDKRAIRAVGLGDGEAGVGHDGPGVLQVVATGLAGRAERDAHALESERGETVHVGRR